jgi:hypothetical protein
LYFPRAGIYRVWLQAATDGVSRLGARCTVLPGISQSLAASYLSGQIPHGIVTGRVVMAPGTDSFIPDSATVGPAGSIGFARYFGLTNLSISAGSGIGGIMIQIGQPATATSGQSLAANQNNLKVWSELAGASVHVFSSPGTTVNWRARYI